jgi:hypothetical protein
LKDEDDSCFVMMQTFPDYETPAQYEKRTGKPYPDNGLVFYSLEQNHRGLWCSCFLGVMREPGSIKAAIVVVADPPVPPPDDWRPE